MSHQEILQQISTASGFSWDAIVEPSASLADLNKDSIEQFVIDIKNSNKLSIPNSTNHLTILRKLALIKEQAPTRAALLLFGKNPEAFFSSAFLKLGRFRSATYIVNDLEIHGPLFEQIDRALNWFHERLETTFVITGAPKREVIWEYPLEALREAVTNAVCHRDYLSHAHTQIRLYDDKLEIINAGSLPPTLTPALLLQEHNSIPRNKKIAECLFYAGYIERWGSGTLRIKEELNTAGLPIPEFESSSGHFKIILSKTLTPKKEGKDLILSERQKIALNYIEKHGAITRSKFCELLGTSKSTALRDLKKLVDNGILTTTKTKSTSTNYRLAK